MNNDKLGGRAFIASCSAQVRAGKTARAREERARFIIAKLFIENLLLLWIWLIAELAGLAMAALTKTRITCFIRQRQPRHAQARRASLAVRQQ